MDVHIPTSHTAADPTHRVTTVHAKEARRRPSQAMAPVRELEAVRQRFNRPSAGGWGILFNPFQGHWLAVRGKHQMVYASTAAELCERIISGSWASRPLPAAQAGVCWAAVGTREWA